MIGTERVAIPAVQLVHLPVLANPTHAQQKRIEEHHTLGNTVIPTDQVHHDNRHIPLVQVEPVIQARRQITTTLHHTVERSRSIEIARKLTQTEFRKNQISGGRHRLSEAYYL